MKQGVILVNKPKGFTSFDVIAKLRGILHERRLGHSGTLDPMATGVLPVFVSKATKACDILPENEKSYRAGFSLGFCTDTQDTTGEVVKTSDKKVSTEQPMGRVGCIAWNLSNQGPFIEVSPPYHPK